MTTPNIVPPGNTTLADLLDLFAEARELIAQLQSDCEGATSQLADKQVTIDVLRATIDRLSAEVRSLQAPS